MTGLTPLYRSYLPLKNEHMHLLPMASERQARELSSHYCRLLHSLDQMMFTCLLSRSVLAWADKTPQRHATARGKGRAVRGIALSPTYAAHAPHVHAVCCTRPLHWLCVSRVRRRVEILRPWSPQPSLLYGHFMAVVWLECAPVCGLSATRSHLGLVGHCMEVFTAAEIKRRCADAYGEKGLVSTVTFSCLCSLRKARTCPTVSLWDYP